MLPLDRSARSENPLTRAYWFGVVDARPLALFRIALGVVLLFDLWPRFAGLSDFLTDDGVFPRELLPKPLLWSLFNFAGSTTTALLLLIAGAIATVAFTLGVFTRVSTFVCWVFWVSVHRRVPVIHTGGDAMADIMLFFGLFADLSGRWSLDARRKGSRAEVMAFVPRLMAAVPACLYLETARMKLRLGGAQWLFGPVIFQHMHTNGWIRPLGVALGEHPALCALATGSTIVFEFGIPLLHFAPVWVRPTRVLAVACHVGLQVGILLTMKVGSFTYVMLALTTLWIQPEWLDAIGGRLARAGENATAVWTPVRIGLGAFVGLVFFGLVALPAIPRHLPPFVGTVVSRWLGLNLTTQLFTHGFPSVRWETAGMLADGTLVDAFAVALPGADMGNGLANSQWMQLPYRLEDYGPLGRLVCDRYNRAGHEGRAALTIWELSSRTRQAYLPGESPPAEERKVLLVQRCSL
jgi:hypothetical protein